MDFFSIFLEKTMTKKSSLSAFFDDCFYDDYFDAYYQAQIERQEAAHIEMEESEIEMNSIH